MLLYAAASGVDGSVRVPRPQAGSSFTYRNHPPHWQRQPTRLVHDDPKTSAFRSRRSNYGGGHRTAWHSVSVGKGGARLRAGDTDETECHAGLCRACLLTPYGAAPHGLEVT